MYKYLFLFLAIFSSNHLQAEPIKNIKDFQSKIEKCVSNSEPSKCLNKLLAGKFPPGNEEMDVRIQQVTNLLEQWLAGSSVYKVHFIKNKPVGEIADNRYYAIESSTGGFMLMEIQYVWILGNPYLLTFNVSSTSEDMNILLSGNL